MFLPGRVPLIYLRCQIQNVETCSYQPESQSYTFPLQFKMNALKEEGTISMAKTESHTLEHMALKWFRSLHHLHVFCHPFEQCTWRTFNMSGGGQAFKPPSSPAFIIAMFCSLGVGTVTQLVQDKLLVRIRCTLCFEEGVDDEIWMSSL